MQVALLRVNHLRTQCASQVLLEGVSRAGEVLMALIPSRSLQKADWSWKFRLSGRTSRTSRTSRTIRAGRSAREKATRVLMQKGLL